MLFDTASLSGEYNQITHTTLAGMKTSAQVRYHSELLGDVRMATLMKWFALTRRIDHAITVAVDAILICMGSMQTSSSASPAPLNSEKIVDRMQIRSR